MDKKALVRQEARTLQRRIACGAPSDFDGFGDSTGACESGMLTFLW